MTLLVLLFVSFLLLGGLPFSLFFHSLSSFVVAGDAIVVVAVVIIIVLLSLLYSACGRKDINCVATGMRKLTSMG